MKQVTQLKSLTRLSLADTALTDDGAKQLQALRKLQLLDLAGTKVSGRGLAELEAALPELVKPRKRK